MNCLCWCATASLALGCGLIEPVAKSPCAGLYCVGVTVQGVPGSALICYDSEPEAKAVLESAGCTTPAGKVSVCPAGTEARRLVP